jgi:hypothetical protein
VTTLNVLIKLEVILALVKGGMRNKDQSALILMNVRVQEECVHSKTRNVRTYLEVTDVFVKMVSNEQTEGVKPKLLRSVIVETTHVNPTLNA